MHRTAPEPGTQPFMRSIPGPEGHDRPQVDAPAPLLNRQSAGPQRSPGTLTPPEQARFAVIDVETTGLSPTKDRVLELGIVLTDGSGQSVWEWVSRFNPQGPVGATHVHGIGPEDVADAPLFGDVVAEISQTLQGRVLVAHNARFDVGFLTAEFERAGWEFPAAPMICTLEAAKDYLPHLPRRRLADCCAACVLPLVDAHSALGDSRATAALLGVYASRAPGRGTGIDWQLSAEQAAAATWPSGPVQEEPLGLW